ncbi:CoA-binding protein [Trinickia violacea]|nr:CoA-binding protein [Trinickia violacea]
MQTNPLDSEPLEFVPPHVETPCLFVDYSTMNERVILQNILERDRVIAVVGLSNLPHRPSHSVAAYMQAHGYRIVPINPAYANDSAGVLGERCYATLADAARALAEEQASIDMVNVFRRADDVLPVAADAVAIGAKSLWLQVGVVNEEAAALAVAAGLDVAMDVCVKVEHERVFGALHRAHAPAPRVPGQLVE